MKTLSTPVFCMAGLRPQDERKFKELPDRFETVIRDSGGKVVGSRFIKNPPDPVENPYNSFAHFQFDVEGDIGEAELKARWVHEKEDWEVSLE